MIYTCTLIGYSVFDLAHEISHKISYYTRLHHHSHDHHHTIKDHHDAVELLEHHHRPEAIEEGVWINLISYYQGIKDFHFHPPLRSVLTHDISIIYLDHTVIPPTPPPCNLSHV